MASGVAVAGSAELHGAAAARRAGARQLSVPPPLTSLILVSAVPSRLLGSSVRDGVKEAASCQRPSHLLQCFQNHVLQCFQSPGDATPLPKSVKSQVALVSCNKSTVIFQSPTDPALPFSGKEHFSIRWIWEWRGFQRGVLLELLYCCSFHERAGHVLMPRAGVCWRSGGRDLVPERALGPHVATSLPAAGPLCLEMGEGEARAEGLEGSP